VVGRELPDMICPLGEDHQGRDWGGETTGDGIDNRGSNITNGLRSLTIRTMIIITAQDWTTGVLRRSDLLLTSCVLPE
jgi:hypothetical protein